ncbi:MAG: phosphomethylpyrimidine kinase, partial [Treponemataceae bacterium]|nr:phosphomethylpyrimidine kinase [Treponemataceae bacterium]
MDKRLLTIQDISCVGQCSLTVALPIISACGIETAILPSSVLSNHTAPGFTGWTFTDLTSDMPKIMERWLTEKISFDAFYTGYVSKAQIPCILEIMKKTAREGALRIVDPVMADNGKLYAGFDQDFPQEMKKLVNGA